MKTINPPKNPNSNAAKVWKICDDIRADTPDDVAISRKRVVDTCLAHGIKRWTASNQYWRWKAHKGETRQCPWPKRAGWTERAQKEMREAVNSANGSAAPKKKAAKKKAIPKKKPAKKAFKKPAKKKVRKSPDLIKELVR